MRRFFAAISALMVTACGSVPMADQDAGVDAGATQDAGPTLTAEQQEWVTAHNAVRVAAMPVPSPALSDVHWDTNAASLAADWASRCDFNHRDPNTLGENLFAATAGRSPTQIVDSWAAEKSNYTYATNTCSTGRACGHYTQIVWRSSVGIGCASQMCTTGSPFGSGSWAFTVCNYAPAGNFIGQKPY
ncbi:MAG: CAP domain-containing protein [Archangium sp.]